MAGPAYDLIAEFWDQERDQRYTAHADRFSDDAVFVDPLFGRMDGRARIREFMELMERVVPAGGVSFELVDVDGGTTCAWSRWIMRAPGPDGTPVDVAGQSLYRVRDGMLTFDADYIDPIAYRRLRPGSDRTPDLGLAAGASAHLAGPDPDPLPAALAVVRRFWEIQDGGRYTELSPLFSDDAVFEDLVYGRFEGHAAIVGYMEQMEREMPANGVTFHVHDIAGDDTVAWSQWTTRFPTGDVPGWTLYRVRDGLLTLDADFFDVDAARAVLRAAAGPTA
jgi:ketosteroid isomerase-like protein